MGILKESKNNMEKAELLKIHGNSRVSQIAGILHNYTPNGTMIEAQRLEYAIQKFGSYRLSEAFQFLEEFLEMY